MKLSITIFNILFGVISAIGIGQFANIGGSPAVIFTAEVIIGFSVGIIASVKIRAISIRNTRDLLNVLYLNISLWFGIAAGFLGVGILISMGLLLVFSLIFGYPETTPWPHVVDTAIIPLLILVTLSPAFLLGKWFFLSSYKFIQNKENKKLYT